MNTQLILRGLIFIAVFILARDDAHCVIHTHSLNGTAVSANKDGLLPISQQAVVVHSGLGYHDYEGIALNPAEQDRLVNDLGSNNFPNAT